MPRFGILSDTHDDKANALPRVIDELLARGAEAFIHGGDIESKHCGAKIFGGLPVICALNREQLAKPAFQKPPPGWIYTTPDGRVLDFQHIRMYVGHKRLHDFVAKSEEFFRAFVEDLRDKNDGLRWLFSGHTHHQVLVEIPLVRCINPGAVTDSFDGHEFAMVDTNNLEVVFSRIPETKIFSPTFSIGIISDSLRISEKDPCFWRLLAEEFHRRDVGSIIHCGNISLTDIGGPELEGSTVYCYMRPDQMLKLRVMPYNWTPIIDHPIVDIRGYKFYVQLDLSRTFFEQSESDMEGFCLRLRSTYFEVDFILCGLTHNALCSEQQGITIINPGDVIDDRNFVVLCLPRKEITFGRVPLPE